MRPNEEREARVGAVALLAAGMLTASATAATNHVWSGGSHTPPYASWGAAATNIQAAVDYASTNYPTYDTVLVTNGTYSITNEILVTNAITVRSVNGKEVTTVSRSGSGAHRIFSMTHAGARIQGLTIRNGYNMNGAGIYMTNGIVSDCLVCDNRATVYGQSAGGLYMTGGTVSNCVVSNNYANMGAGGGIYMTAGLLVGCTVVSNELWSNQPGAGVWASGSGSLISYCVIASNRQSRDGHGGGVSLASGARLHNSLVRGNTVVGGSHVGGGVYMTGAGTLVESCTLVENVANGSGGGVYMTGGAVSNSIVYFNAAGSGPNYVVAGGTGLAYSCATPLAAGAGNTDPDPQFANRAGGNLHVLAGPARNTGLVLPWMSGSADLDGHVRLDFNGKADMGAYQTQGGALACSLSADPPSFGVVPLTVTFNSEVDGTNTSGLGYQWDFDNDGTPDAEGVGLAAPSHAYTTPGRYSVRLVVTNAAGESAAFTNQNLVTATTTNLHVAANGSSQAPYTNAATAATNFMDAFDIASAGTWILVNTGVHSVSRSVELTFPIRLTGVQGATDTTLRRTGTGSFRVIRMTDAQAVVEGLTIANGSGQDGAGVYMTNGTLRDCIVTGCSAGVWGQSGGGIHMTGGSVSNCVIRNNYASGGSGGGVYMTAGELYRCTVVSNDLFSNQGGAGVWASGVGTLISHCVVAGNQVTRDANAGGVYLAGGATLRNCLVRSNSTSNNLYATPLGGGVYLSGAGSLVESCTIVDNLCKNDGGGIYINGGSVSNSIVYFNHAPINANYRLGGNGFAYSCTTPLPAGTGNLSADPLFVDPGTNDYRLQTGSPCIDKGLELAWMADQTDLDGGPRVQNRGVEMGAYETFVPAAGTVILLR